MIPTASQREFREKIIDCFRTELAQHLGTLREGLDAVAADTLNAEDRAATLHGMYRAAHTIKGAARAVGVTIVEHVARSLENVLYAVKTGTLQASPELFSACWQALDAIQAVRITYENNELIPPYQATQALTKLDDLWNPEIALRSISGA